MKAELAVGFVIVMAALSGCSQFGSSQGISVIGTVITDGVPANETVVLYDSIDDEPTREAVRLAVDDHESDEPGYGEVVVPATELDRAFDDDRGYVRHNEHVVRVLYVRHEG